MQKSGASFSRKKFLRRLALGSAAAISPIPLLATSPTERGPKLAPDLVHEFVRVGHGNLKEVKRLLEQEPALLHASWDWGGGDFETAIAAAAHVGSREVVEFLLQKGARMDLFVAAMMGEFKLVKTLLYAFPDQMHTKGPHGLSLMHHAKKGGERAEKVVKYLEKLGLTK